MIRYDEPYKIHISTQDLYNSGIKFEDILDNNNELQNTLIFNESDLSYLFGKN